MIPLYGIVEVDTQESIVDPEHQQAVCGSIAVSVASLMNVTDDLTPGVIQLELDWQEKSLSNSYLTSTS